MALDIRDYLEMLTYPRAEGSIGKHYFCQTYLEPVFGSPDAFGNYILKVGKSDKCFMAHHDTVHRETEAVYVNVVEVSNADGWFAEAGSSCLGADCTTGVYIILKMIEAKIPGLYIIHAGEEIGCKGSRAIATKTPWVMQDINYAISFDRMGYSSIITHQLGSRTCSEKFAESFATMTNSNVVNLLKPDVHFKPDNTGVYTDSNEYAGLISECTNISVGYFNQHTKKETQDLGFLENLVNVLVNADWDTLVYSRDPSIVEYESFRGSPIKDYSSYTSEEDAVMEIMEEYPLEVAQILIDLGLRESRLLDKIASGYYSERSNKGWPSDDWSF